MNQIHFPNHSKHQPTFQPHFKFSKLVDCSHKNLFLAPQIKIVVIPIYIALLFSGNKCTLPFGKNVHFQKCPHLSAQSLLLYFKHVFDVNNWSKFGSFNSQGEAPYPYIKRKFKDLSRLRGIISYFHHPLKDLLQSSCWPNDMPEGSRFFPYQSLQPLSSFTDYEAPFSPTSQQV